MAVLALDPHIAPPAIVLQVADRERPAAGGGRLLPSGFLSTSGSQIVDAGGRSVRIASIGWNGTDSPPGAVLAGLWQVSYRTVLDAIVAGGFNTVRIPWTDAGLDVPLNGYNDRLGWIHTSLNWDLVADPAPDANGRYRYVTTLQLFEKVVSYAGQIGLKVIFDHHTNEGTEQKNGLWFDLGPGSAGRDGGVKGRVTAETFKQNWVRIARTFAGNPTVIGFDLHNEPNGEKGLITWGGGGPTDIKAMCETVGAAIQSVNRDALIICPGPFFYAPPPAASGMDPGFATPSGNLTAAGTNPVKLPIANKLVYTVHEYPDEVSDIARFDLAQSGAAYVDRMNRGWGYLVRDNIAPVWIGEMGSSLRTQADRDWAATLIGYMSGDYGNQGGPTFGPGQQPISGSWWLIGPSNDPPYGIQTEWGIGNFRSEQRDITDRMLMR
ncbi:cellulase family glycosylhydrolase [Bradyrhizobium sp. WSM 1704]|uniref:glycoside hydrolase family 5 protein n=1 Tax=Bradyrhizobium semiaridum TaxID=2821404 RepID=UPI001CE242B0|nr:cellulase family glycosylhydrolase [Bradyrhizobium semiaridum]MCA6120528.1 cellulase family glycosylhydrolase [Bradyrhizobium semiaridum]